MWISDETRALLWLGGKAFFVALILTPILRDVFRFLDIVDRPGERKVHAHPIPRIGGLSVAAAYVASLLLLPGPADLTPAYGPHIWRLLPGAAVLLLTGLLDDLFDIRPVFKLAGQAVAASLVYWGGLRMDTVLYQGVPPWLSLPLTLFWLLLTANAFNLIDGLDGLCAGMGLLATLTLFGAALLQGNIALAGVTLPLVGALAGFLCYNLKSATIFLGDSGAMLVGFLLGCYGLIWAEKTTTLLSLTVPLLAMSVPLLDAVLSILRRFLRRQPIFTADSDHIHHRLLAKGLSPFHVVLALYFVMSLVAVFAMAVSRPDAERYKNLILVAVFVLLFMGIRKLQYTELRVAGRLLFAGGLQRTVNARLVLERLNSALEAARGEEEWWNALASAVHGFGWYRVEWRTPAWSRDVLWRDDPAAWRLELLLQDGGVVSVEGPIPLDASLADWAGFAEIIHRRALPLPVEMSGQAVS